jgi:hypothetical protein
MADTALLFAANTTFTTMTRRNVTAHELLVHAKANSYKNGADRDEDNVEDARMSLEKTKGFNIQH